MIQLHHGECLAEMAKLPDACVDLILCDLPYGTTQNKWDTIIDLVEMWKQYKRICKGAIVLTAAQPFTSVLVMSNVRDFKYQWVWEKEPSGGLNSKKQPLRAHEDVLIFKGNIYNPQDLKPTLRKRGKGDISKSSNYGKQHFEPYIQTVTGFPTSILSFAKDRGRIHPTQKPVALMEYLIRTYTNEGMTVLDNCMGSGTIGVACVNTGRSFIGIEQDAHYFAVAQSRILSAEAAQ